MNNVNEIIIHKIIKKLRPHYKDYTIIYDKEYEQVIITFNQKRSAIQLTDHNISSLESAIFVRSLMLSYERKAYYNTVTGELQEL